MAWFPTFPAVLVWPLVVSLFLRMELQLWALYFHDFSEIQKE
jgi:hypothetical protein